MAVLLGEKEAIAALRNLVKDASPEGSLYGLLGLHIKDASAFNQEAQYYKSKEGPPERELPPLRREDLTVPKGYVVTQNGIDIEIRPKKQIVGLIESGRYDEGLKQGRSK